MITLELCRQRANGTDAVAAVHSEGADDGPVQIISAKLLEHYQRCEAELIELRRLRAISYVLPAR